MLCVACRCGDALSAGNEKAVDADEKEDEDEQPWERTSGVAAPEKTWDEETDEDAEGIDSDGDCTFSSGLPSFGFTRRLSNLLTPLMMSTPIAIETRPAGGGFERGSVVQQDGLGWVKWESGSSGYRGRDFSYNERAEAACEKD